MSGSGNIRLQRSGSGGRYSLRLADGAEAKLDFVESGDGIVTITHTWTPPQHRGQGTAARLVAKAVEDFRAAGLKVVPACWFARDEFLRHPDWADTLYRREETKDG